MNEMNHVPEEGNAAAPNPEAAVLTEPSDAQIAPDPEAASPEAESTAKPLEAFARLKKQVEVMVVALQEGRVENQGLKEELETAKGRLSSVQNEFESLEAERREVCEKIEAVMLSLSELGLDASGD